GPWEVFNITSSQFWTRLGTPLTSMPALPSNTTYLDNDGTRQNASGSWTLLTGSGFLYADGDITLTNGSWWKGLIYCEGDLKIAGNAWVLGAVVCRGHLVKVSGDGTVLYSKDALIQYVGYQFGGGNVTTLS